MLPLKNYLYSSDMTYASEIKLIEEDMLFSLRYGRFDNEKLILALIHKLVTLFLWKKTLIVSNQLQEK